jgi:hypothetical protein
MDRIAHLVALADPDEVAEVVGDDAQMITVVRNVGREERSIAPAVDDLLAPVRGLPVHFHVQLVGLHEAGRLPESFAPDLGQEEDEAVGSRVVALEGRVGLHGFAPCDRSRHEVYRGRRVPDPLGREK